MKKIGIVAICLLALALAIAMQKMETFFHNLGSGQGTHQTR